MGRYRLQLELEATVTHRHVTMFYEILANAFKMEKTSYSNCLPNHEKYVGFYIVMYFMSCHVVYINIYCRHLLVSLCHSETKYLVSNTYDCKRCLCIIYCAISLIS